uniref:Cadherin_C domain-containing protein n=1 Tax=Steinernema glaseri TaxID=37863 RepID=A0A1I8A4A0_9BILA
MVLPFYYVVYLYSYFPKRGPELLSATLLATDVGGAKPIPSGSGIGSTEDAAYDLAGEYEDTGLNGTIGGVGGMTALPGYLPLSLPELPNNEL